MVKVSLAVQKTLRLAREKTISNAWQLLHTAIDLFEREKYTTACFLAMTSIEEVGKLVILRMAQGFELETLRGEVRPPTVLDEKALSQFIRNHHQRALQAAAWSLYINAGADRRHGVHPASGMHRTSGIVLLARSGRWMVIRNSCLYTDVNLSSNWITSPSDSISRDHAYYFICMGFEVLAEQAEAGFGLSDKCFQFCQDRLADLESFMERWSPTVDIDGLDFLANPEPLREEAKKREA